MAPGVCEWAHIPGNLAAARPEMIMTAASNKTWKCECEHTVVDGVWSEAQCAECVNGIGKAREAHEVQVMAAERVRSVDLATAEFYDEHSGA